ncbi:hypothetical protein N0V88_002629 [Collariella sp. IMI 366227]|nr:hypothetical protein N0V88_002629 [Collariella sp. IMI 366227]
MSHSLSALFGLLGIAFGGFVFLLRKLYPKPYPGIPYNEASAKRLTGDILNLAPIVKETNEFSNALLEVTTQRLGTPIAQLLFPNIRKPLVILEDPREIEDIIVRRGKEFDKAPMALDIVGPMFPRGTLSQFTTPELKALRSAFGPTVAAPNIHKSTCQLMELWQLKSTTSFKGQAFNVHEDFKNAALDAIWVAVVGEEPGTTQHEIRKLQSQLAGNKAFNEKPPVGSFLKKQVDYISTTIARNSNSPSPKLAQKLETYTPRYRKFRSTVSNEMRRAMKKAVERYQSLEVGKLEDDAIDTCAMDLVLRRQLLQAKKAGVSPSDPTKDESMLDEMFVMLVGGHDSTANALTWFVRFMEALPVVQTELRSVLRTAFPGPKLPSVSQILEADIPYLDGTCEECLRLAGTAKANLRQALVDTQILGCPIPKGAEIFMNFHINRAPVPVDEAKRSETSRAAAAKRGDGFDGVPGRDLARFQPRRWTVVDEKTGKEAFNAFALPSLAFGGRKLAMMDFRIVVVLLILSFEFLPLPEEYQSMAAIEKVFREPKFPYAKLKALS